MPPPAFRNKLAGSQIVFPSDGTDAIFARLLAMLRAYPPLHGCTIRGWDDPSVDNSPPSDDGPPWVRLTPSPGMAKILCRAPAGVVHRIPLVVEIEQSTPGTDVLQSQRLWGAIGRAIFATPQIDSQLQSLGVSRIAVGKPSWAAPADGATRCYGKGSIELQVDFLTTE